MKIKVNRLELIEHCKKVIDVIKAYNKKKDNIVINKYIKAHTGNKKFIFFGEVKPTPTTEQAREQLIREHSHEWFPSFPNCHFSSVKGYARRMIETITKAKTETIELHTSSDFDVWNFKTKTTKQGESL